MAKYSDRLYTPPTYIMLISPIPKPIFTDNFKSGNIQVSFNLFYISKAFYNAILQVNLNSSWISTKSSLDDGGHTTIMASINIV